MVWADIDPIGVCHGDDLIYLFKSPLYNFTLNGNDIQVKDMATKVWVNFAMFGDPTPPGT